MLWLYELIDFRNTVAFCGYCCGSRLCFSDEEQNTPTVAEDSHRIRRRSYGGGIGVVVAYSID